MIFSLNEVDLEQLLKIVQNSNKSSEIIEAYEKYKEQISNTTKLLLENKFLITKRDLIEKLQKKIQKSRNRWIQFRRKVLDPNIQENIWQLHVGTLIISVKTTKKEIYCPLILREVNININESKISISSNGLWKINQKVSLILS